MATFDQSIADVLALLPPDGTEMRYVDFESAVDQSTIKNSREALRWVVRKNLIGKRLTNDKTPDPNTGKPIFVLMVKRLT